MKIGIMGGTFDPIHIGHLIAAERALEETGLDEVRFMPAHVPPHKTRRPAASSEQRLEMVRLAVENRPGFTVTDIEMRLGGTSYSVDTMAAMKREQPDCDFYYIVGADMLMYLPEWHRVEDLAAMVTFIGLNRPGTEIRLDKLSESIRRKIRLVEMPLLDISSTDIRSRCRAGHSVRYLVQEPVRRYMEENGLYES